MMGFEPITQKFDDEVDRRNSGFVTDVVPF